LNLDSDVIEHIEGGPRNKQLNHHGLQSLTLDIRLSKGIGQVNRGNYEEAISIFNMLLEENPKSCDALLGRGTAYAFLRKLEIAITDFSKAIEVDPTVGEAWKRRGQARAAIGATTKVHMSFPIIGFFHLICRYTQQ
jgi:tetratricopeptide (TPR) repeat protein